MAINHKRPLPVHPERLDELASTYTEGRCFDDLSNSAQREILNLALLGELIEHQQNTNFFLGEAYDIYNARYR